MQQTNIDLWLRRKFIYITRVYCNTLPDKLPLGLLVEEAPEESGGRYLYKLTTRSEKLVNELVEVLKINNITYTTRVEDRDVWMAKWLNNPHQSFTFRMAWYMVGVIFLIFVLAGGPQKIWAALNEEETPVEEVAKETSGEAKIFQKKDGMREIDRRP